MGKYIISMILGAVIGGAATYFYCVGDIEDKYNKRCALCRQDHERITKEEHDKTEALKSGLQEIINRTEEEKKRHQEERMNYNAIRQQYENIEEEGESYNVTVAMAKTDPLSGPYIIDDISYISERAEYEKLNLLFYFEDGILAVDEDYVMDPTDGEYKETLDIDFVGAEAIRILMSRDSDGSYSGDYVYVRNERLGCDYEIKRASGHFYE